MDRQTFVTFASDRDFSVKRYWWSKLSVIDDGNETHERIVIDDNSNGYELARLWIEVKTSPLVSLTSPLE